MNYVYNNQLDALFTRPLSLGGMELEQFDTTQARWQSAIHDARLTQHKFLHEHL
jgi:hypothetical protein